MQLDGAVLSLEAEVAMLERDVKRLNEQNKELSLFKVKVRVLEQEMIDVVKQVQELATSLKAGLRNIGAFIVFIVAFTIGRPR
jgi:hypothetical protein